MGMRKATAEPLVQKLRFVTRRDFWGFVAHFALSRLQVYNPVA